MVVPELPQLISLLGAVSTRFFPCTTIVFGSGSSIRIPRARKALTVWMQSFAARNPSIRQTQYAGWIGDSLQLARRVSLDLGVRYEIYSPLEPRNPGGAAFFDAPKTERARRFLQQFED